jgi:hypothetical protein
VRAFDSTDPHDKAGRPVPTSLPMADGAHRRYCCQLRRSTGSSSRRGDRHPCNSHNFNHAGSPTQDHPIAGFTRILVGPQADVVRLRLGLTPVELPEPLATLTRALVATRTGHAAIGETGTAHWLFPGGQPGRPISAAQMGQRLRKLGLSPNPARSAALFSLATELPAAVLARMLGISIDVAVDWQHTASGDWANYAADVSRRTTTNTDQ